MVVLHEGAGGLQGGGGDAGDGSLGSACLPGGLGHHLHRLADALDGAGVGGKDDGVARLHTDHGLVDDGGGGVGGGHQPRHDTNGHPDVDGPLLLVLGQDAVGLFPLDGVVEGEGGKAVLDLLVLRLAVARLLHRHLGQPPGVLRPGL